MKTKELTSPQRILERAIEVLEEQGEAGIRTHQIAEDCGVTAPILYRAFGDREGLIVAANAERYRRNRDYLGEQFREAARACSSREQFRGIVGRLLEFMNSPDRAPARRFRASVLGGAVTRPDLAAEVIRADALVVAAYADALALARQQGWVDYRGDFTILMYWLIGAIDGRVHLEIVDKDLDTSQWDALLVASIMGALFGNDGR
jgi:AcrR family transcriptional regulator